MSKKLSITFMILSMLASVFLFQNCFEPGGGIVVDNPLHEDRKLELGFKPVSTSNNHMVQVCILKVLIRADDFEGSELIPPPQGEKSHSLVVGSIRDVFSNQVGEVRARVAWDGNGYMLSSFFEDNHSLVQLNNNQENVVFELDIPNGNYSNPTFEVYADRCEDINNNSVAVDNGFGSFSSTRHFNFDHTSEFSVIDNEVTTQEIDVDQFVADMLSVQSNAELDDFLTDDDY